ncbi:hypothetical protein DEU56DRAFT_269763 [Suillus clintonianus]|uniref:uncharacterized protein n=1 Tax=Suillus clintonianus TaxID=1904413 RepID=UPI001B8697EB|nr:uncharacterized protein DEU56DRAFT_269763 [Suillus clintonianus]KAG2141883.1 hypothetical protein DEU56DRAFT_269763 [Suillus clintonianus]
METVKSQVNFSVASDIISALENIVSVWWMFGYSSTSRDAGQMFNVRSVFASSIIIYFILFDVYLAYILPVCSSLSYS